MPRSALRLKLADLALSQSQSGSRPVGAGEAEPPHARNAPCFMAFSLATSSALDIIISEVAGNLPEAEESTLHDSSSGLALRNNPKCSESIVSTFPRS